MSKYACSVCGKETGLNFQEGAWYCCDCLTRRPRSSFSNSVFEGIKGLFGPPDVKKLTKRRNIEKLLKILKHDKSPQIRGEAAIALGKIGKTPVLEDLREALKDSDLDVRQWADWALQEVVARSLSTFTGSYERDRKPALALVGALRDISGEWVVEALLDVIRRLDFAEVNNKAGEALCAIGGETVMVRLTQSLKDPNNGLRRSAALTLGKIGGERALVALTEALEDRDVLVRRYAVHALLEIGGEGAVRALMQALKDAEQKVRDESVEALLKIGGGRQVEILGAC